MKHWPLFLAILAVVCAATLFNFGVIAPDWQIKQGLDLKGGMRVVLEVDHAKIGNDLPINQETAASVRQILADRVNAFGISGATVQSKGDDQFVVEIPASPPQLINIETEANRWTLKPGTTTIGAQGTDIVLKDVPAKAATVDFQGASVTVKAEAEGVKVNNTRLPVGETRPLKDGDRLQIGEKRNFRLDLPVDAQSQLGALQKTAVMEFYWFKDVRSEKNPNARYRMDMIPGGKDDAGRTQPDTYKFIDTTTNKEVPHKTVIEASELIVDGKEMRPVSKANLDPSKPGEVIVSFEFKSAGAQKFAEFTRNHVGDILAIVLDDVVIQAPRINSEIPNGQGIIEGGFKDMSEAMQIAQLLNAGSLPVPLKPAQTQIVGATLGQDSVERSIQAGLVGLGLVLGFMLIYYLLPGVLADIALLFYATLTFALFKVMGVVLDLPGITGFILSVGMAVDANILIFERLKEEIKSGKTLHAAVDAGFSRAFTSIFDSNMTTWITCAILYWFGSNLIKGFAITLALGVAVSMFTAVTVTRTMLHLVVNFPWARNAKLYALDRSWLPRRFREGQVLNVTGARRIYFTFSIVLMILGIGFIAAGGLRPGIDFTGGSVVQVQPKGEVDLAAVRTALQQAGFEEATPQVAQDAKFGSILSVRTPLTDTNQLEKLRTTLTGLGGGMTHLSTDQIGPSIAAEVVRNAFISVVLASLMIILYLAKQFALGSVQAGFRYGVCAVIALLHNVIVVTGFFAMMGYLRGWIVDSLFVTAILTVIGYSVHDTIVVYDRIRENLRNRQRGETFEQVANRSITQTFDRSMTTGITVLLALSALLVFGGPSTALFNWALLIGIAFGTYASIFVASSLVVLWEQHSATKQSAGRAAAPADVRLRPAAPRSEAARPRPVSAGATSRTASRVTAPVGGDGDDAEAGSATTAAGRQQIKPKRKRRM